MMFSPSPLHHRSRGPSKSRSSKVLEELLFEECAKTFRSSTRAKCQSQTQTRMKNENKTLTEANDKENIVNQNQLTTVGVMSVQDETTDCGSKKLAKLEKEIDTLKLALEMEIQKQTINNSQGTQEQQQNQCQEEGKEDCSNMSMSPQNPQEQSCVSHISVVADEDDDKLLDDGDSILVITTEESRELLLRLLNGFNGQITSFQHHVDNHLHKYYDQLNRASNAIEHFKRTKSSLSRAISINDALHFSLPNVVNKLNMSLSNSSYLHDAAVSEISTPWKPLQLTAPTHNDCIGASHEQQNLLLMCSNECSISDEIEANTMIALSTQLDCHFEKASRSCISMHKPSSPSSTPSSMSSTLVAEQLNVQVQSSIEESIQLRSIIQRNDELESRARSLEDVVQQQQFVINSLTQEIETLHQTNVKLNEFQSSIGLSCSPLCSFDGVDVGDEDEEGSFGGHQKQLNDEHQITSLTALTDNNRSAYTALTYSKTSLYSPLGRQLQRCTHPDYSLSPSTCVDSPSVFQQLKVANVVLDQTRSFCQLNNTTDVVANENFIHVEKIENNIQATPTSHNHSVLESGSNVPLVTPVRNELLRIKQLEHLLHEKLEEIESIQKYSHEWLQREQALRTRIAATEAERNEKDLLCIRLSREIEEVKSTLAAKEKEYIMSLLLQDPRSALKNISHLAFSNNEQLNEDLAISNKGLQDIKQYLSAELPLVSKKSVGKSTQMLSMIEKSKVLQTTLDQVTRERNSFAGDIRGLYGRIEAMTKQIETLQASHRLLEEEKKVLNHTQDDTQREEWQQLIDEKHQMNGYITELLQNLVEEKATTEQLQRKIVELQALAATFERNRRLSRNSSYALSPAGKESPNITNLSLSILQDTEAADADELNLLCQFENVLEKIKGITDVPKLLDDSTVAEDHSNKKSATHRDSKRKSVGTRKEIETETKSSFHNSANSATSSTSWANDSSVSNMNTSLISEALLHCLSPTHPISIARQRMERACNCVQNIENSIKLLDKQVALTTDDHASNASKLVSLKQEYNQLCCSSNFQSPRVQGELAAVNDAIMATSSQLQKNCDTNVKLKEEHDLLTTQLVEAKNECKLAQLSLHKLATSETFLAANSQKIDSQLRLRLQAIGSELDVAKTQNDMTPLVSRLTTRLDELSQQLDQQSDAVVSLTFERDNMAIQMKAQMEENERLLRLLETVKNVT